MNPWLQTNFYFLDFLHNSGNCNQTFIEGNFGVTKMAFRKLFCSIIITAFITTLSGSASAGNSDFTRIGITFRKCKMNPEKQIFAWLPGWTTYCYWNTSGGGRAKKEALRRCDSSLPDKLGKKAKCRIAYDGNKIVDALFAKSLKEYPKVPITLTIYDDKSKKLQKTPADFVRFPHNRMTKVPFKVVAKGIVICSGHYRLTFARVIYTAKCFGDTFHGKSKLSYTEVLQNGGWTERFPKLVKLLKSGSYIILKPLSPS